MPHKTKTARRNRRSRFMAVLIILVLLIALGGELVYGRLQAPLPSLTAQIIAHSLTSPASTTLNWPNYGQSAIGAAGYGVLAANGVQKAVPTASIAKLITALAVLRVKPLSGSQAGPTLTLGAKDVDLYYSYVAKDGSVVQVEDGELITEREVLQAILLPSANNLADSLAIWAFGSLTAYANYANAMLTQLGLTHTHVGSDASGFAPDSISTATDLVRLGELSIASPVIAGIVSQSTANLPLVGVVNNVNWLLGTAGINGLKTGNSDQAGGAFLFSAAYQVPGSGKITIVAAILGATGLLQAMRSAPPLLTSAQTAFSTSVALAAGQAVGVYHVPWGNDVTAVTAKAVTALAWQGQSLEQPKVQLTTAQANAATGTAVGTVRFGTSGKPSSVVLSRAIPAASIWWRLPHY